MRPPPRLIQTTSQTPALPGFAVSGEAKLTGFATFRVSSGFGEFPSLAPTSDPSVLKAMKGAEAVSVQRSTLFERVQMAASVERPCSIEAPNCPHSRRPFERVQTRPSIEQSPRRKGSWSTHCPSSFERVQFTPAHPSAGVTTTIEHDPYLNAFKRNPRQPRSGPSPATRTTAPPFERVQMPSARTPFPSLSRPRNPNGPTRRPLAQTTRPRSTSPQKEANPMSSTQ